MMRIKKNDDEDDEDEDDETCRVFSLSYMFISFLARLLGVDDPIFGKIEGHIFLTWVETTGDEKFLNKHMFNNTYSYKVNCSFLVSISNQYLYI